jgi:hypothetical protein
MMPVDDALIGQAQLELDPADPQRLRVLIVDDELEPKACLSTLRRQRLQALDGNTRRADAALRRRAADGGEAEQCHYHHGHDSHLTLPAHD